MRINCPGFILFLICGWSLQAIATAFEADVYANSPTGQALGSDLPKGLSSIREAIRSAPRLQVSPASGEGQASFVSIDGVPAQYTLVVVDGVVMNDPTSPTGTFDLAQINPHFIQSMRLITGAEALFYGVGGLGGVLVIETKDFEKERAMLALGAGNYGAASSMLGFKGFAVSSTQNTGWSIYPGEGNERDGRRRSDWNYRWQRDYSDLSTVTLAAGQTWQSVQVDQEDQDSARAMSLQHSTRARVRWHNGNGFSLGQSLVASERHESNSEEGPTAYDEVFSSQILRSDVGYQTRLSSSVYLQSGISFEENQKHLRSLRELTFDSSTSNGAEVWLAGSLQRVDDPQYIRPILRTQCVHKEQCLFNFGFDIFWEKVYSGEFRLSWSSQQRPPTYFQKWSPRYGRADLQAEKSENLQLSWVGQGLTFSFFSTQLQDQIVFTDKYENLGRSQIRGVTGSIEKYWIWLNRGGITYLEPRNLKDHTELVRTSRWMVFYEASIQTSRQWTVSPGLNFRSGKEDVGGRKISPRTLTYLASTFRSLPWILEFKIDNVLNDNTEEARGISSSPRIYSIDLILTFE